MTDLREKIRSPGYTPAARDAVKLVALLTLLSTKEGSGAGAASASTKEDDATRKDVERALARLGVAALPALIAAFRDAKAPVRAELCRAIGKLGDDADDARAFLLAALDDPDAKTRRNAIRALGKLESSPAEDALLAAWAKEPRVDHRRSLAEALGKTGGPRALAALGAFETEDPELRRILDRARLMLERTALRAEMRDTPAIDPSRAPGSPVLVALHCRSGLERLLLEELANARAAFGDDDRAANRPRAHSPGVVRANLRGAIADLFVARTWHTLGFPLPPQRMKDSNDVPEAILRALTSPEAKRVLTTWNTGTKVRYRIAWRDGGHKRAVVWDAAKRIAEAVPDLVNDPKESAWEVAVTVPAPRAPSRHVEVELLPRALVDPRFAYRVGDVPAASHPALAAALARVAGVDKRAVVWDPFCGSGTELIERARLGPYTRLIGSDLDPHALEVAAKNIEAAGVRRDVSLVKEDATSYVPEGVTLVITNPPMGRRLARVEGELPALIDRFVDHVAHVLAPRGRLVWISPRPERTLARARAARLHVELTEDVDMGGFPGQIQALQKR